MRRFPNIAHWVLGTAALGIGLGCDAHITTDAPPPSKVDVQVDSPPAVDVDVNRKPADANVDVNVKP